MILSCSSSNIQKLAIWEYQTKGSLKMRKVSAEPSLTNGNSCYSLAGAEYSVYTDTVERCVISDRRRWRQQYSRS